MDLDNLRASLTTALLTMTLWQDWYTQGCCTSPYCNANMSLDTSHMFTIPGKSRPLSLLLSSVLDCMCLCIVSSHTLTLACELFAFLDVLHTLASCYCMPSAVLSHCCPTSGCAWTIPGKFQVGPPGASWAHPRWVHLVEPPRWTRKACNISLSSLLQRESCLHLLQHHRLLHRSNYFTAASMFLLLIPVFVCFHLLRAVPAP